MHIYIYVLSKPSAYQREHLELILLSLAYLKKYAFQSLYIKDIPRWPKTPDPPVSASFCKSYWPVPPEQAQLSGGQVRLTQP